MKNRTTLTYALLAAALTLPAGLAAAEFADPVRIEAGGEVIRNDESYETTPCWVDFDGDGHKDLLVGEHDGGEITFYRNNGDGTLAPGELVQAEGETTLVPESWLSEPSTPQLVDLNNDGVRDLLVGTCILPDTEGLLTSSLLVLWGRPDGTFQKAEEVKGTDGEALVIAVPGDITEKRQEWERCFTRAYAVDWDDDGDLDLVTGNINGSFYLFRGEGEGTFNPESEPILAGDNPLSLDSMDSAPFIIDWDGDGDLDLLTGSSDGHVFWSENTAQPGQPPRLTALQILIETGGISRDGVVSPPDRPHAGTSVWAGDVNGDGKLDLIVSDSVRLLELAEGVTEEEMRHRIDEIERKKDEFCATTLDPDLIRAEEAALNAYLAEIVTESYTSFVWVYIQE